MPLDYVGLDPTASNDLSFRDYVAGLMGADMTTGQVDAAVAAGLTSYATKAYVDAQDALLADKAYIDAADSLRIRTSTKDQPNGVLALQSNGKVSPNRINVPASNQRLPKGPWTPTAYNATLVSSSSVESALFACPITDPGYAYRLLVTGMVDGRTQEEGVQAVAVVRAGTSDGQVIAEGRGTSESYSILGVDYFQRTGSTAGAGWEEVAVGPGNGHAATNGNALVYVGDGTSPNRLVGLRRTSEDGITIGDYQEITYITAYGCDGGSAFGAPARNRIFGRVSADRQSYVFFEIDDGTASLGYCLGGVETYGVVRNGCNQTSAGIEIKAAFGSAFGVRACHLWRNGQAIINYNEVAHTIGAANRGWGVGFQAGFNEFFGVPTGQVGAAGLAQVTISDALPGQSVANRGPVTIAPVNLSGQSTRTGATTLYVRLIRGPGGTPGWTVDVSTLRPRLFVVAVPA